MKQLVIGNGHYTIIKRTLTMLCAVSLRLCNEQYFINNSPWLPFGSSKAVIYRNKIVSTHDQLKILNQFLSYSYAKSLVII